MTHVVSIPTMLWLDIDLCRTEPVRKAVGMKRTTLGWALTAALGASVVVAVMLTPLGFETRPATTLTLFGIAAIGTVFIGIVLDLVSIFLLARKVRLASKLAVAGSIVFVFPIVVDRADRFFSLPIPPAVAALEYALMAVLLVTLGLGWAVFRASGTPQG